MKTIRLCDFGKVLLDRGTAKKVFVEAEKENFEVIFDLEGVEIGPSFSDELFVNGLEKFGKVFRLKNASDTSKAVIRMTLSTRKRLKSLA